MRTLILFKFLLIATFTPTIHTENFCHTQFQKCYSDNDCCDEHFCFSLTFTREFGTCYSLTHVLNLRDQKPKLKPTPAEIKAQEQKLHQLEERLVHKRLEVAKKLSEKENITKHKLQDLNHRLETERKILERKNLRLGKNERLSIHQINQQLKVDRLKIERERMKQLREEQLEWTGDQIKQQKLANEIWKLQQQINQAKRA